ncbi:MFS general substrate transporter [Annulohypoxylon maeteangense]|uniref:MFS general substrate transporter n=1 Tax=Annulohypoxylon maeteangense TaxID=1927788 RepID=UPI0020088DAB|nr:MFS general substrate transporter [Annulohypoxylon maeteangense]KAI0885510.1 MFS general substrate transporter [Annulohypoxylon maeteangense]
MPMEKDMWVFGPESQSTSPDDLHEVCLDDDTGGVGVRAPLPAGSRPECLRSALKECIFVVLIAFSAATPVFLQRSVVLVAGSMSEELEMTPAQIAWATASSGLTTGAFLLPFGYIADTCAFLPRKTLLIISLVAFSLLVSSTSLSPNGIVLDIISGLTGIACAANVPIAVGLLSLVYPKPSRRKNMVFSSFLMGTPAATIIGGLGSGALALQFSWKAPFIALAILYSVVCGLACIFVPNIPEPETSQERDEMHIIAEPEAFPMLSIATHKKKSPLLEFDWVGLVLLITGLLLFTIALTIGPQGPEPWKTPTVILLLTLGVLSLGCFLLWEKVTQTPMIPPSIWENWTVTLVIISTLGAAMSFYSQLFWVSLFMQDLEGLKPFDVAVRLLPQALVGLLLSPLVGLIMHKVPGTVLLGVAAGALVASNVLLVFLHQGSNYLIWIFPSVVLSTIGMDWTMNVGSLYILSSLPLKQHSIGASVLQTTSRLGVPLGMGVTTAIWSSYDRMQLEANPEIAYTNTFIATAAFAGISLSLVPFIHIGRQGHPKQKLVDHKDEDIQPETPILSQHHLGLSRIGQNDNGNRPSKRWSPVDTLATSAVGERQHTIAPSVSSQSSRISADAPSSIGTARTTIRRGCSPSERVVWVVCEECGTSKRHNQPRRAVGDPARYFNDSALGGVTESHNHQTNNHTTESSSNPTSQPHAAPQLPRQFGGRRRLPLVNRQIMTHQMLTQGFQP